MSRVKRKARRCNSVSWRAKKPPPSQDSLRKLAEMRKKKLAALAKVARKDIIGKRGKKRVCVSVVYSSVFPFDGKGGEERCGYEERGRGEVGGCLLWRFAAYCQGVCVWPR